MEWFEIYIILKLNLLLMKLFDLYSKWIGDLGCSRNTHEFSPDVWNRVVFARCEIPTHSHLHFRTCASRISRIYHAFGTTCITRHGVVTLEWKQPRKRKVKENTPYEDEREREREEGGGRFKVGAPFIIGRCFRLRRPCRLINNTISPFLRVFLSFSSSSASSFSNSASPVWEILGCSASLINNTWWAIVAKPPEPKDRKRSKRTDEENIRESEWREWRGLD